jgi:hypothetical protein
MSLRYTFAGAEEEQLLKLALSIRKAVWVSYYLICGS